MVFAFLKKYPEVAPLILIVGTGCVAATVFMIRQATKNPEACWDKKNNPHPWLNIKHNEQVKLFSHSDYKSLEKVRPEAPIEAKTD